MPPKSKDKSSRVTLFNLGSTPVVYSSTGHTLGCAEWRTVDQLDEVGQRAVEDGLLTVAGSAVWPEDKENPVGESAADGQG